MFHSFFKSNDYYRPLLEKLLQELAQLSSNIYTTLVVFSIELYYFFVVYEQQQQQQQECLLKYNNKHKKEKK